MIDIFVNCNWVDTQWQQYNTHLHTKQYTEQYNETQYLERNIHNNKNV